MASALRENVEAGPTTAFAKEKVIVDPPLLKTKKRARTPAPFEFEYRRVPAVVLFPKVTTALELDCVVPPKKSR
jgi:hypothetical protein